MRRLCLILAALIGLLAPIVAPGQPAGATPEDWEIPNGRFYTQAARPGHGYPVVDADGIPFWTTVRQAGGAAVTGYPISRRYVWNGFTLQAFQKTILQWQPVTGRVAYVNIFDVLHDRGHDGWLRRERAVPEPAAFDEPGKPWEQIVRDRQALLDREPAIRERYFAAPNPIDQFGLPVSPVVDLGSVRVVRLQRAVIQLWTVKTAWADAGQVTVANGGDLAREAGLIPAEALEPVAAPPLEPSSARLRVRVDAPLRPAIDALDLTRAGRPLVEALAESEAEIVVGNLPEQIRAAYLPFLWAIVVNRSHLSTSAQALATLIGHEAVHLRDDLAGVTDGSAWQCYQSELRAFKTSAEIWREFYPRGKPDPADALERELNELLKWAEAGSDLDRLYSLGDLYHDQCSGGSAQPPARIG